MKPLFGRHASRFTLRLNPRGYDPARPAGAWSWHWSLRRYATCRIFRAPGLIAVLLHRPAPPDPSRFGARVVGTSLLLAALVFGLPAVSLICADVTAWLIGGRP